MSKTEKRCCEFVSVPGEFIPQQCSRSGDHVDVETGERYCKQHLPSEVRQRKIERERLAIKGAVYEVANIAVKALHQEATYDDVMEAAAKLDRLRGAGE
jgi:hypothetical protein